MLFDPPQALGLVLDISFRRTPDGKRLSTKVRNQLVEFVKCLEGDDALYLCQDRPDGPAINDGSRSALMGNWEAPELIDLAYVLEYTLASLAQEDLDGLHHLCLVTDRIGVEGLAAVATINQLREKPGLECRFLIMGVGRGYDCQAIAAFCQAEAIDFRHVDGPERLSEVMTAWVNKENHGSEQD